MDARENKTPSAHCQGVLSLKESNMPSEDLAKLEYEVLRAEERDRMNARLQVWTIFLSLVGAFGLVSVQSGTVAYVAALFPLLACCLARHVRHSEDALRVIRKYLYQIEKRADYEGYEHFTRCQPRTTHGGYLDALRDALLITQLLALAVVVIRLALDHFSLLIIVAVIAVELFAAALTWRWLKK
jgi:hypothetical protein